jgi:hypothetical protein
MLSLLSSPTEVLPISTHLQHSLGHEGRISRRYAFGTNADMAGD